jgi:hypothetical protein
MSIAAPTSLTGTRKEVTGVSDIIARCTFSFRFTVVDNSELCIV